MSLDNKISNAIDWFFDNIMNTITIVACVTAVMVFLVHLIRYLM